MAKRGPKSKIYCKRGHLLLPSCNSPIAATDHNHVTGEFRGLMCKEHNTAIGLFADNSQLLREAADYLEGKYGW